MKTQLDSIIQYNNSEKLYQLFLTFFATKFKKEKHEINEQSIELILQQEQWEHSKILKFLEYLNECASIHFVAHSKTKENNKHF